MWQWVKNNSVFIAIFILAVGLRLPLLNGSFWLDEAAQALESARPFSQQLQIAQDFQPPLLHLLLAPLIRISTQEWWLRLWGALLPGLITILGTYVLGKKLVNKQAATVASLLLATSSFHIFYSQELRPYALPAMWAVLSWLALITATDNDDHNSRSWFFYTLSTSLGLYSSYLYPFVVIPQLVWVFWTQRQRWWSYLLNLGTAAILFAPWLPSFFEQLAVGTQLRTQLPGWDQVVSTTQLKTLLLVPGKFLFGVMNIEISPQFVMIPIILLLLLGYSLYRIRNNFKQEQVSDAVLLLGLWLILPFATAWIISFFVPVIQPKRLLYLIPAAYLLIAHIWSIEKDTLRSLRPLSFYAICLILGLNLVSTFQYYTKPQYQRENWRELHQQISNRYPPSETVAVFSFPGPFAPWRWYDRGTYPTFSTEALHISDAPDLSQRIKTISEYRYVLLFEYLRDLTDPEDVIRPELWALGFREIDSFDYPQIGFVRVYSRSRPTAIIPSQYYLLSIE